jgi:hypothetical protein
LSQLVAYYDENPIELKNKVDIQQLPIAGGVAVRSIEGLIRTKVVYVPAPTEAGLLIPFGQYDDWSLVDRYNEALRIMNSLGAKTITCESFGEATVRRGFRNKFRFKGAEVGPEASQRRIENSAFDYRHEGAGGPPRDPGPLRWPNEPGFVAAVTSVLMNGVTEVEINIRSSRSHSLEGKLGVQLTDLGFDLGAGSERTNATRLHIRATFPPPRRGWK